MWGKPNFAAGYYPLVQDKNDWEKDIKEMKKSGISLIRTAELFCAWDQIETEEGSYHFQWLDEFFDLCNKYEMKILLGTGTASPPYWLHLKYPDINIVSNHKEQYPNNISYSWACFDHPEFIKAAKRYITKLVSRYQNHDALYAYQIHNEISFPFMPLHGEGVEIYSYNESSCIKFRQWLENKYGSIEKLNYAYRWGATHTWHHTFEEIEPPKAMPVAWSSVTRWLDWRLFWMENTVSFIKWQNDMIKKLDSKHITTTNIFFLKSQDTFGVLTGLDQFEMAKVVDVIGYDIYPGSGNKTLYKPEFSSMCLDLGRSTAKALNKETWLLETESGPINGWVLGPDRNVNGQDIFRNIFDAIGHGYKLCLFQGYREWDFQPIHWGGLVDLEGKPTPRLHAVNKIGKLLSQMEPVFETGKVEKAKIAMVLCKQNAIILKGIQQEEFLYKALRGAYQFFWSRYHQIDFISESMLEENVLAQYKMLYMPFFTYITKEMAEKLSIYVKNGGILVGTARMGMLGEYGWYNHKMPCYSLADVFGIDTRDAESNTTPKITYDRKNYDGFWHKENVIIEKKSVKVLARFSDDMPAVTLNRWGKGKAIYFGTHPDVAWLEKKSNLLTDVLQPIMKEEDILPQLEINYSQQELREIDGSLVFCEKEIYLFVTSSFRESNNNPMNGKKLCETTIRVDTPIRQIENLMAGENIEFYIENKEVKFYFWIEKNETIIFKIKQ